MKGPLPLRPHHALCLQFFAGYGYSGQFVDNMTRMKAALEDGATVTLTDRADCICRNCPNRTEHDGCSSCGKVERYDRAVLEQLGMAIGDTLPYADLIAAARVQILARGKRELICGDCQWTQLCK